MLGVNAVQQPYAQQYQYHHYQRQRGTEIPVAGPLELLLDQVAVEHAVVAAQQFGYCECSIF